MIKALKKPQIQRLWFGQALSSIGDEIYRVGLVWLAIGIMGENTGYLAAGQIASLMLLSFIGGKWADHWDPRKTMISVDLIRAVIVVIPVIISFFMPNPLFILWMMAFTLAGLSAFFDPATQALIPVLAEDPKLMQATNGLMSTTLRLARMTGPAVVGLLSAFVPMIHFFTIDAITFCISAYCVYSLKNYLPEREKIVLPKTNFKKAVMAGFDLVRSTPGMNYVFITKALTAGTWGVALGIGFPLLIHHMTAGNTQQFGIVMASYGVGNFIGALYFGGRARVRQWELYFSGQFFLGVGFFLIGFAPSINLVFLAAALTGFAGPINDLAFVDMIQQKFKVNDIAKIFRFRMAIESSMGLLLTFLSPWFIRTTSIRSVFFVSGAVWVLCGAFGLIMKGPYTKKQLQALDT